MTFFPTGIFMPTFESIISYAFLLIMKFTIYPKKPNTYAEIVCYHVCHFMSNYFKAKLEANQDKNLWEDDP